MAQLKDHYGFAGFFSVLTCISLLLSGWNFDSNEFMGKKLLKEL